MLLHLFVNSMINFSQIYFNIPSLFKALPHKPSQKYCTDIIHSVYELQRDEVTFSTPWWWSVWAGF